MFPTRVTPIVRILVRALRAKAEVSPAPLSLYMYDALRYLSEEDVDNVFSEHKMACTISDTLYNDEDKALREKTASRCGTIAAFTPNPADVSVVEHMFYPYIEPEELTKLEEGEFVIALTIDSVRSKPFFAKSIALPERKGQSHQDLMVMSRERYATSRVKVDQLFKRANDQDKSKKKGKDDEPGSFSDAFRSIFTKRAGQTSEPTTPPKEAQTEEAPKTAKPGGGKKPHEKRPAGELPETELREMLYVEPVMA